MNGFIAIYGSGNDVALYPKSALISATIPSDNKVLLKFRGSNSAVATLGAPVMTGTAPNQSVGSIAVTNGGGFYTSVPTVTISGNATGTAVLTNGAVTSITIGGTNDSYSAAPTVSIEAPDFAATPARDEVILSIDKNKAAEFIAVLAQGENYSVRPGKNFVSAVDSITKGVY